MKFLSLTLTNFGPYFGVHEFNLADRGLLLIMGENLDESRMDSNGSGKSYIFDGLDWCCWGKNPRGDHAEAVFNEEAFLIRGMKCEVHTRILTDENSLINIIRSRTKSKCELHITVDGVDKSSLDIEESQRTIERVLGMDRDVFHAAILFGQTDLVHYADVTDGKRMEILTKILQLEDIDCYLDRVKTKIKENDERKARFQTRLVSVDGQLQATHPGNADIQIAQWEQERGETLARIQQQIKTKVTEQNTFLSQVQNISTLQARKVAVDQELASIPELVESVEIQQLINVFESAQRDSAVGDQECVNLQNQLYKMQNLGEGICSQCRQMVRGEHLQREIQRSESALQEALNRQSLLRGKLEEAERLKKVAEESWELQKASWQAAKNEKIQESARLGADLRVLSESQTRLAVLAKELGDLQTDMDRCQSSVNPWIERKAQVERSRCVLEQSRNQLLADLGYIQEDRVYLDFWAKALGSQGLKSYILDSRRQELSDAANEWLSWLTGGTIWVRFETQKQTRGKKLVNAPDVRVFRWNPDGTITERNYRSWSGGEKQRISFCIDFGLSRLVARRASKTYDLLVLDEVFKHLDTSGKEAVMDMLKILVQEKSSLIAIEHDTEFQGQFDSLALVSKKNCRSSIKEIDYVAEGDKTEKDVSGYLSVNTNCKRIARRQPVRRPVK